MQVADFKNQFTTLGYNYDPTNLKQSYWLAINNGDTYGVAGTTSYCGSTCKRTYFNLTSTVAQTVYLSVNVHSTRQYVESPCTSVATSTATPRKYMYTDNGTNGWYWD